MSDHKYFFGQHPEMPWRKNREILNKELKREEHYEDISDYKDISELALQTLKVQLNILKDYKK